MSDILILIILILSLLNFLLVRKKSVETKTVSTQVNLEDNAQLKEKLDHLEDENRRLEKLLFEQQSVIKLALRRIVPTGPSNKREAFCNVGPQNIDW